MADIFDEFESNYSAGGVAAPVVSAPVASAATADPFDAFESSFQASQSQAPGVGLQAASGFLGGLAGMADLASVINKYNPFPGGGLGQTMMGIPTPDAGNDLRSLLDSVTGVQDSTKIGEGSLAYKVGEYLPGVAMGGGNLVANGVKGTALNIGKLLGLDAITAVGGEVGEELGGPVGEAVGATAAGLAPSALGGLLKRVAGSLDNVADSAFDRALGVQYGDKKRGLGRMPMYTDANGNMVPHGQLDDAVAIEAPIQQQLQLVKEKGFLSKAPNAPGELKVHLQKIENDVGENIRSLISEADATLADQVIIPEFTETQKLFKTLGRENPTQAKALLKEFEKVVDNYQNAGRYIDPVTKEAINQPIGALQRINSIKRGTKHDLDLWNKMNDRPKAMLYKSIYKDLEKLEDSVFDVTLPSLAGKFREAKDTYGALKGVGKTLESAAARNNPSFTDMLLKPEGSGPLVGLGGLGYLMGGTTGAGIAAGSVQLGRATKNALKNAKPLTYARGAETLGSLLRAVGLGSQSLGSAGGVAPLAAQLSDQALSTIFPGQGESKQEDQQLPIEKLTSSNSLSLPSATQAPTKQQISLNNSSLGKLLSNTLGISEAQAMEDVKAPQVEIADFETKVDKIASNLDAKPEHLLAVMNFETGGTLSSTVKNKAGSGATGLIQFMPATAKELTGSDTKEAAIKLLSSMTPTEQLDYVEKYLEPFKGKLKSLEDVYMAVLYPRAVGKDNEYALFEKGTKAYWQNKGLDINKDGVITKAEATQKVKNYSNKITKV